MKPISLKIVGYLDLKSLKQFKTKAELIAFRASQEIKSFAKDLLKSFVLESKIEQAKAKLTTPFRRYCAKVIAVKNYKQWLFSLPRAERMAFKFN